jgi:hypothetical protein
MDLERLRKTPWEVVALLVSGRYDELEALTRGRRLTSEQIREAVSEYPCRLIMPPDDRLKTLVYDDIVEVKGSVPRTYAVDVNLYTAEEGRSDLTLSVAVTDAPGDRYRIEIDGIHVL